MALDFPNTPSLNQTFTGPNGTIWMWDGVKWVAITSTSTYAGAGNVGRNLLHNPLFNVAQRGVGSWTVNGYTVDRWLAFVAHSNGSANIGRIALSDANRTTIGDEAAEASLSYVFTGGTGAGDFDGISQRIEDVYRLGGKTVTVSFWAVATSGTPKIGIGLVQNFGTGGAPSTAVTVNAVQVGPLSSTWTRYSVTLAVPSTVGKTLGTAGNNNTELDLYYSSGTTNNTAAGGIGVQNGGIALWGMQLEIGSVATPLEKPDPCYNLLNCQRFYQIGQLRFVGYQAAGSAFGAAQTLPVTMRASPTLTPTYTTQTNCTGGAIVLDSGTIASNGVATALGTVVLTGTFTASADL